MLELHCHTTCSDGTLTPAQLVQMAHEAGVKALAITDHDTLAGWDEARAAAEPLGLEIVPGLELSTIENGQSVHILGFYPDPQQLGPFLAERLAGRRRRAIAMSQKLAELGFPIDLPQLPQAAAPGRPHIAAALVQAGHVENNNEAFDRFLKAGGPAYVPYEPLSTCDGIRALREAGAVPVWAHAYCWKGGSIEKTLPQFVEAGLMGLEVYHPSHMPHQREKLTALCQQYELVMTGGSDYHGPPRGEARVTITKQSEPRAQQSLAIAQAEPIGSKQIEPKDKRGLNRYELDLEMLRSLKAAWSNLDHSGSPLAAHGS